MAKREKRERDIARERAEVLADAFRDLDFMVDVEPVEGWPELWSLWIYGGRPAPWYMAFRLDVGARGAVAIRYERDNEHGKLLKEWLLKMDVDSYLAERQW
jgi:hypothetical protein